MEGVEGSWSPPAVVGGVRDEIEEHPVKTPNSV